MGSGKFAVSLHNVIGNAEDTPSRARAEAANALWLAPVPSGLAKAFEPKRDCRRWCMMGVSKIHLSDGTESLRRRTPWESLVLAYAAMLPIAAGALACLLLHRDGAALAVHLTVVWSGGVLCFLSGVRRGLSFRQEGGPVLSQLATMLWLFVLGVASLLSPWAIPSLVLQMLGYATMAVYDPIAAREGEAPRYFQRLRPVQMLVPIASLALVLMTLLV